MKTIEQSNKLDQVCYDIRGPIVDSAQALEKSGKKIMKLHIGNPAAFGFDAPQELIEDVIRNLTEASGYCDSKGLFSARKAVMQYYQQKDIQEIEIEHIYLGNGVSELIGLALQGLLNNNDEVLVPAPDYPLWTAAVNLAGGKAVHYRCDASADWFPDLNDIEQKITSNTQALVLINPNNPTGALYSPELIRRICELARKYDLILFSDEIYDKILFDGAEHTSTAALAGGDLVCVTFGGLSKNYRAAGFRSGWMLISGDLKRAKAYLEGLTVLSSMRLCANVPAQFAIQTALGGYQSIYDLVAPGGRLHEQRNLACDLIEQIPGLSCVKPRAALYLFVKVDQRRYPIGNDVNFALSLLKREHLLVVQGSAFNWPELDHFRMVFLPYPTQLRECFERLGRFLSSTPHKEWQ